MTFVDKWIWFLAKKVPRKESLQSLAKVLFVKENIFFGSQAIPGAYSQKLG
jgi:hypothetical protein